MKFKLFESNQKIENNISKKNLYVALIGEIHPEYISEDSYIHRGEDGKRYAIVRKNDNDDTYTDLFENTKYMFRDEVNENTILKLYPFVQDEENTNAEHLQDILNAFDEIINEKNLQPANNKVYTRTRNNK